MNKTIKKIFSLSVLMIVVALIFTGCTNGKENQEAKVKSEENPKELTKVTVSEFRGVKYAPVHVAYQNGYYEDEGLDIEFAVYGDGPVAFQGMHAGDSQFCLLSIDPVFRAFDEGLESKLIAAVDTTRLYGFAGSKDITDISQLKGKSVLQVLLVLLLILCLESIRILLTKSRRRYYICTNGLWCFYCSS